MRYRGALSKWVKRLRPPVAAKSCAPYFERCTFGPVMLRTGAHLFRDGKLSPRQEDEGFCFRLTRPFGLSNNCTDSSGSTNRDCPLQ